MEPEQNHFDSLRHWLALKRHEQPPPGFFDAFPDRVRARIRAGEEAAARPWWERWQEWLPLRPALAGTCVLVACAGVLWKLGDGTSAPSATGTFAGQNSSRVSPADRLQPLWVGGSAPGDPGLRGASSTAPVTDTAPPGMFAPGAGLRRPMVQALVPNVPRLGIQTEFGRGEAPRLTPTTNGVVPVP
jgi:hypothetical protein